MSGLATAFLAFGAKGKNPYSWSARTPDDLVVMTFWFDQFGPNMSYSNVGQNPEKWHQPRNRERIEDLKWARDRWEGKMGVVIIKAVNTDARPRVIETAYPRKDLLLQLDGPIRETGEFAAINVGTWDELRASYEMQVTASPSI